MHELINIFYNKYIKVLSDLSLGYDINKLNINELWELMCVIHYLENTNQEDDDWETILEKYTNKRFIL